VQIPDDEEEEELTPEQKQAKVQRQVMREPEKDVEVDSL
jgi:hypothetical protein